MDTIRIRLHRVVDFGPVVSMTGVELATQQPITVHLDYRTSESDCVTWRSHVSDEAIIIDVDRIFLSIDLGEEGAIAHAQPR